MIDYEAGKAAREMSAYRPICTAPRDGTFIRLRCRPGMGRSLDPVIGHWQSHEEMKVGGWWFDRDGNYISPGPIEWAPENSEFQ